jgi:hypothetical protein
LPKTKAELVEIQSSVKRKKDLAMYLAQHALSHTGLDPLPWHVYGVQGAAHKQCVFW